MVKQFEVKQFMDERGTLMPIEFDSLAFTPLRSFVISQVPVNEIRGNHAHLNTKQVLVCVSGRIRCILKKGIEVTHVQMRPGNAVYVPEMIWDAQQFLTPDAVLLVLASTHYNPNDYIDNYGDYLKHYKAFK